MLDRPTVLSPLYGMRIYDRDACNPAGYSPSKLVDVLNSLQNSRRDYDMLLESATFAEIDEFYNPGEIEVSEDFILEAIVVDKFSRTERRMAAVVRVLNKHLGDSEIKALDAIVGKPRKTGSYAYVTVQLPFSDGQVVSVIFHAPEGDKRKIGPSDQIIAFRWLLNKRDITQVVAPEDGSEISLESIAKRVTQLVVKNSARFERTQKDAQAERQELDKAREALKDAEDKQRELMDGVAKAAKDAETIDAQLSNTLAKLEKQKTINAELQAKLDALKKAMPDIKGKKPDETKQALNIDEIEKAFGPIYSEYSTAGRTGLLVLVSKKKGYIPNLFDKPGIGPIGVPYGKKGSKGFGLAHIIERRDKEEHDGENFVFNVLPKLIEQGKVEEREKFPGRKYIVSDVGEAVIRLDWDGKAHTWLVTAYPTKEEIDDLSQGRGSRLDPDYSSEKTPPDDSSTAKINTPPSFVNDLNDILIGKYDGDTDKIDQLLDQAAAQAESAGQFDANEDLFNQAADHLTELLKAKAGNV